MFACLCLCILYCVFGFMFCYYLLSVTLYFEIENNTGNMKNIKHRTYYALQCTKDKRITIPMKREKEDIILFYIY
jgi:hypothetical protein